MLSFAGFVSLSPGSGGLSISQALTSLSILALLNRPLANLSVALPALAGAVASFDRIQDYLNVAEREDRRTCPRPASPASGHEKSGVMQKSAMAAVEDPGEMDDNAGSEETMSEAASMPEGIMVEVDATLTWPESEKPVLDIRELKIPSSAVTVLVGPTGCGKTTLLNSILGELTAFEGSIRVASLEISYCAQKPWLPNITIREAIIGKLDYDMEWYLRTVHACALEPDLAALPAGDQSSLGNKGTLLSGGQKQRIVSLAFLSRLPLLSSSSLTKERI